MPNTPPAGTSQRFTMAEDATGVIAASYFGFTDPDAGNTFQAVRIDTLPATGTLWLNNVAVAPGQVIQVSDINLGRLTFTAVSNASATGGAGYAAFTFSVSDGIDFDQTPNTLTIDVYPVADAPSLTVTGAAWAASAQGWVGGAPVQAALQADNGQFAAHHSAVLSGGNIVVSYFDSTPGGEHEHFLSIFDQNGNFLASRTIITDTYTGLFSSGSIELSPDWSAATIVPLANGGFATVWRTERYDYTSSPSGDHWMIMYQAFTATGVPATQEVRIAGDNALGPGAASGVFTVRDVDTLSNGAVAVALSGTAFDSRVLLVDASGTVTNTIAIDSVNISASNLLRVTPIANGGFLLTWRETIVSSGSSTYKARIYDNLGSPAGSAFVIDMPAGNNDAVPTAVEALANGNFVLVSGARLGGMAMMIIAPDGSVVQTITSSQGRSYVNLEALPDGTFIAIWSAGGVVPGASTGLHAQRFLGDGTRVGAEMILADGIVGNMPEVTFAPNGSIVLQWQTSQTTGGLNYYIQSFTLPPLPTPDTAQSLAITTAVTDTDGSEALSALTVRGLPTGFVVTDGTHSVVSHDAIEQINIFGWNLASLTVQAVPGYRGVIGVDVVSTSREGANGATLYTTRSAELSFLTAQPSAGRTINGVSGSDTLTGTANNDIIFGLDGNDVINGGDGDDFLVGGGASDTINGGNGNDTVYGGSGANIINGGAGNDMIYVLPDDFGSDGADNIDGGTDIDTIYDASGFQSNPSTSWFLTRAASITNVENYVLTEGRSVVHTNAGVLQSFQSVTGLQSIIQDTAGTTNLSAVAIVGNSLTSYTGSTGADTFTLSATYTTGVTINGGGGADVLTGGAGDDTIDGGAGNDVDTLNGGGGNDRFIVNGYSAITDIINGGTGINTIVDASGLYLTRGATTTNVQRYETGTTSVTVNADALQAFSQVVGLNYLTLATAGVTDLSNTLFVGNTFAQLIGTNGADTFTLSATQGGNVTLYGNGGDDRLTGGAGNDILRGGIGDDQLFGGAGNDRLEGDDGNDTLYGGDGDDTFVESTGSDTYIGGSGIDTVQVTLGYGATHYTVAGTANYFTITSGGVSDAFTGIENISFNGTIVSATTLTAPPTISIASVLANRLEGASGTTSPFTFTVTRTGNTNITSSVTWSLEHGTTDTSDFSGPFTGTVSFAVGETSKTLTVLGVGDAIAEGNETFSVRLATPIGANLGTASASGIIQNDDTNYSIAAGSADRPEGGTGALTPFSFTVTRSGLTTASGSVAWTLVHGSTSPTDFSGTLSGSVSFAAGETSKTITVNVVGDALSEPDESFSIALSSAVGGVVVGSPASGFIRDDDSSSVVFSAGNDVWQLRQAGGTWYALDGDDRVIGTSGQDTIYGDAGADELSGGDGSDFLFGGIGSDTLNGDVGFDSLYGGAGDDTLNGGANEDILVGDAGNDTLNGGDGGDILSELFDPVNSGNDTFDGGNGVEIMYSAGGNDTVSGGTDAANNYANLGDGDDSYSGSAGSDVVEGGPGIDTINGNNGDDSLYGDGGNDIINGGAGIDLLSGSTGDDVLDGGADNDLLIGDAGNDTLIGGSGIDVLFGFADNDILEGGAGTDGLFGGAGADKFRYLSNAAGAVDYDYIWDFSVAEGDALRLSTTVFANQAAVLAASSFSGGNTTITMGNGNFIVLVGANIATFTATNFEFV